MSQGLQLAKMTTFTTMEPFERPAIVMDCGTGFTKMGFAGNLEVCHTLTDVHRPALHDTTTRTRIT